MSNTNKTSMYGNSARFEMEGQVDLSAAGAVSASRGDGVTVVKNGTGLYDITVTNPSHLELVKVMACGADLVDAAIGTVKDVGVKTTVAKNATSGSFTMTIRTVDAAGADVDEAANALTVGFRFVIQTARMSNPLD
jgi:hypothetical protein